MNNAEKAAELRRLIGRLLERITDVERLERIYGFINRLYNRKM